MSPAFKTALTGLLVFGALLSDWVNAELYLRDDTAIHVVGALAINALVLIASFTALHHWLGDRRSIIVVRAITLLVAAMVIQTNVRLAVGSPSLDWPLRLGLEVGMVAMSIAVACRASESMATRLMRAIGYASVAFVVTPMAWHAFAGNARTWIDANDGASTASALPATRQGTVFLLLDELGFDASAPIGAELRKAGLNVDARPLVAAGPNTTNVIPMMFSGQQFTRAQPCGRSTICSGTTFVDFSQIRVLRPDVHVTGLLHPYCDIGGLQSCFQLAQPHPHGNAYRGLLAFYLQRLWPPLASALKPADPAGMVRGYLRQQREFIDTSRFWRDGGVLYAHLYLPHPPGLDGPTTLDADYANNIGAATELVRDLAARLKDSFGVRFTLVITSDHPLRATWCPSPLYAASNCALRPAFVDARVPLIVATPLPLLQHRVESNAQAFSVLNAELHRPAP